MRHATIMAAALLFALAAPAARATCTPNGNGGTCVDALDYLEDDIAAGAGGACVVNNVRLYGF